MYFQHFVNAFKLINVEIVALEQQFLHTVTQR